MCIRCREYPMRIRWCEARAIAFGRRPASMWAEYLPAAYRQFAPDVRPLAPANESLSERLARLGAQALLPTPPRAHRQRPANHRRDEREGLHRDRSAHRRTKEPAHRRRDHWTCLGSPSVRLRASAPCLHSLNPRTESRRQQGSSGRRCLRARRSNRTF